MMGTFRDFLDLFHLLSEASARGAAGVAKVLARRAKSAGRALKAVFLVSGLLFVVLPVVSFGIGFFGGGRGFFVFAGLAFGIGAALLALFAAPLGIVLAAIAKTDEGAFRWYLRVSVSLLVAALFSCLLLQVIPWERNRIMMPVVLVAAGILAITNAWIYSPRFIKGLTTLLLLGAIASIFFPTSAASLGRTIERVVNGRFVPGPNRVDLDCGDILAGTVRFFSDAGAQYWVYRDEDVTEFFSQPGPHPAYNVALAPVTEDDVRREVQRCEEEREQVRQAAEAAIHLRDSTIAAESVAVVEAREAAEVERQRQEQAKAERTRLAADAEAEAVAAVERRARARADSVAAVAEQQFRSAQESVGGGSRAMEARWRQELTGKAVALYYSSHTASLAGEFAGRLERLGARVRSTYGNPRDTTANAFEIYYRNDDLRAATAIQAATVDLRRLDLTSDGRMIGLAIWFR